MNELLRHMLATISYRFNKAINEAGERFGETDMGKGVRTPTEIVNHMNNVLEYAICYVERKERILFENVNFSAEVGRFCQQLKRLDQLFENTHLSEHGCQKLIQGPLSDVITHIGQLAMLRRMAGDAIVGESFIDAEIEIGKIEQAKA